MVKPGGARIPKSKSLEKASTTFSPTAISSEKDSSTSTPTTPTSSTTAPTSTSTPTAHTSTPIALTSTPTTSTSTPTAITSTPTTHTSTPTTPTSTPSAATSIKTTPTTVAPGNKRQEEEKSQKNAVLHAPSVRRQDSSGSTADKVAQALAAKKQQSETPEFLRRRHTLNAVSGTGRVDVLAEIRNQKEKEEKETVAKKEKEDKQTERSVKQKLFTGTESLKDEMEEVKGTEATVAPVASSGEVRQTSSASRRKKSVDKPIKTLGIVSEPRGNGGGPTTRMGRRPRRQKSVEKPVKTLEIASDPEPPAWVAIAQVHRQTDKGIHIAFDC